MLEYAGILGGWQANSFHQIEQNLKRSEVKKLFQSMTN
jgi:hypothetical protein